jgi:hypothetical protein
VRRQYEIKGLGGIPFDKRPEKEFHAPPKPFRVPEGYDKTMLDRGFSIIHNEKIKGKVGMAS